jgi:hypothetical protein
MNEPNYPFHNTNDKLLFEFESVSDEKTIKKVVEYRLINPEISLYNLALVDILTNGEASDTIVSNNNDMIKVLSTVFQSLLSFFLLKPNSRVLIQSNSAARIRLYRIAISKNIVQLEHKFSVLGFIGSEVEIFETGKNYDGFVISQK